MRACFQIGQKHDRDLQNFISNPYLQKKPESCIDPDRFGSEHYLTLCQICVNNLVLWLGFYTMIMPHFNEVWVYCFANVCWSVSQSVCLSVS